VGVESGVLYAIDVSDAQLVLGRPNSSGGRDFGGG
jgi:hypothetical protein